MQNANCHIQNFLMILSIPVARCILGERERALRAEGQDVDEAVDGVGVVAVVVRQLAQLLALCRPPAPHPVGEEHAVRRGGVGVVVRARRRHKGHVVIKVPVVLR